MAVDLERGQKTPRLFSKVGVSTSVSSGFCSSSHRKSVMERDVQEVLFPHPEKEENSKKIKSTPQSR